MSSDILKILEAMDDNFSPVEGDPKAAVLDDGISLSIEVRHTYAGVFVAVLRVSGALLDIVPTWTAEEMIDLLQRTLYTDETDIRKFSQ